MTDTSTLNRVERACAQLHHEGKAVTFTAVAATTGLGRTTLYRNPTLRPAVDALATKVRRHEEQLRRLEQRKH